MSWISQGCSSTSLSSWSNLINLIPIFPSTLRLFSCRILVLLLCSWASLDSHPCPPLRKDADFLVFICCLSSLELEGKPTPHAGDETGLYYDGRLFPGRLSLCCLLHVHIKVLSLSPKQHLLFLPHLCVSQVLPCLFSTPTSITPLSPGTHCLAGGAAPSQATDQLLHVWLNHHSQIPKSPFGKKTW